MNQELSMNDYGALDAWIDAHFDEQVAFLQELVKVPTDTPPGNNAPHTIRCLPMRCKPRVWNPLPT